MARGSFGGGAADYVENSVGTRLPGAITSMWTAQTGGTQLTDLIVSGAAATTVTAGTRGNLPVFDGPDAVVELWADAGGGVRARLESYVPTGLTQTAGDGRYALSAHWSAAPHGARQGDAPTYLTLGGDGSPGGRQRVYSQVTSMFNDLVLAPGSSHADLHLSRMAASNSSQLVTITGAPTGGTFTCTYKGSTTAALAFNVAGVDLQTALRNLPSILALPVNVAAQVFVYSATGFAPPAGGPWTVSFVDPNPAALTFTTTLTGGTAPSVTTALSVPDGQMYIDIPLGGVIPVVGRLLGQRSTGILEMQLGQTGGSFRFLAADGTTALLSVQNNGLLTLGSLIIAGNADLPSLFGNGSAGGMALYGSFGGTGTGGLIRFRNNPTDNAGRFQIDTVAPPSGRTTIAIEYNNGTTTQFQYATVGAVDSGGVGFRTVRLPN